MSRMASQMVFNEGSYSFIYIIINILVAFNSISISNKWINLIYENIV